MGYNSTPTERANRAEQELAAKHELERPVNADMMDVFNAMAAKAERVYARSGSVLNLNEYSDDVRRVLDAAYDSSFKRFGYGLLDYIEANKSSQSDVLVKAFAFGAASKGNTIDEQLKETRKTVADSFVEFKRRSVNKSTDEIIQTSQTQLERSVNDAVEAYAQQTAKGMMEAKAVLDDIAAILASNFKTYFPARAAMIATTEIENGAEGAKDLENFSFDEVIGAYTLESGATLVGVKEWHTVGDDKVRPAHREADLQRVKSADPFVVGGEQLMFPRDVSLGATAGNVINCRCAAVYYHEDSFTVDFGA